MADCAEKKCTKCHAIKPITAFYEFIDKRTDKENGKLRFVAACKECTRERQRKANLTIHDRPEYKKKLYAIKSAYKKTDEYKERRKVRRNNRLKSDPQYRLRNIMACAIRRSLLSAKDGKSWEALVGYNATQLREHLERQFSNGMDWMNYGNGIGKWNIDHIIPISAFNAECERDFFMCWSLSNLRPMWSIMNSSKQDRVEVPRQPYLL